MTWNAILVASDKQFWLEDICSKFARNVKYCSNVAKKCLRVLKMQTGAPNSKKCSKGAQRNRERPNGHPDAVFEQRPDGHTFLCKF